MITISIDATTTDAIIDPSGTLREGVASMIETAIQFHNYSGHNETITRKGKHELEVSIERHEEDENL